MGVENAALTIVQYHMSELLKAFDLYNSFERDSYFTLSFDRLPSALQMETPLKSNKKEMDRALDQMQLSPDDYEAVFKDWYTEDSSDSDDDTDYPYQILFKGKASKSLVWISLEDDTLYLQFLYDCRDSTLEAWVLEMYHKLRKEFGLSKKPTFKVLTKGRSRFQTEDVRTEKIQVNIDSDYNDDFADVHQEVKNSIVAKESGLILLYGTPGTGKTTYIKSLISEHPESNFIFIQNEFVNNLLDPDFISFLLKHRDSILLIEDAEKVIASRNYSSEGSVVSTILQLTDGLFSDYLNIKIICTFNTNLSKIDTALLRKGRMLAMYEFKALEIKKTNQLLNGLGLEESKEPLTLSTIYNKNKKTYGTEKRKKIGF